jgi:hypothetical protein
MGYIRKVIIFGLLTLLVAAGAAQALGNKEVGWATYHNYKYNYSIKYPSDWSITEVIPSNLIRFTGSEGLTVFDVIIQEEVSSLEEFVSMYEETWKGIYVEYSRVNKEDAVLGGEPAIEIVLLHKGTESSSRSLQRMRAKFTMKEGIGYAVLGLGDEYVYDIVNQKYFEPMMQSFKFEAPHKGILETVLERAGD